MVAEIVQQDLDRIMGALLKAFKDGNPTSETNDSDDDGSENQAGVEGDEDQFDPEEKTQGGRGSVLVKREVPDGHVSYQPPKRQKLALSSSTPAKVAALRGKAMRREQESAKLQSEAAKFKAEAYELESKWLLQSSE